jgi:hypothetical protein
MLTLFLLLCLLPSGNAQGQKQKPSVPPKELQRRVEYADRHFTEGTTAGSKTDRGQVYIGLGPPDKVAKFRSQFPSQSWLYRNIPDIGTNIEIQFVDVLINGVYKIVPWSPVGDDNSSIEDRRKFEKIRERIQEMIKNVPDH